MEFRFAPFRSPPNFLMSLKESPIPLGAPTRSNHYYDFRFHIYQTICSFSWETTLKVVLLPL